MKLYLVWAINHGERELCDIFTLQGKADADMSERQGKDQFTKYIVEEWEVQE